MDLVHAVVVEVPLASMKMTMPLLEYILSQWALKIQPKKTTLAQEYSRDYGRVLKERDHETKLTTALGSDCVANPMLVGSCCGECGLNGPKNGKTDRHYGDGENHHGGRVTSA